MAASWLSCFCLWRSPERTPLLDVRPSNVFPPPHTVLTAPVPRVRPLAQLASLLRRPLGLEELAASAHRSYDSHHSHNSALGSPHNSDSSSRPLSILEYAERRREERHRNDDERKESERIRQKTLSTAYGSRMCKVDRQSLPPTPTFVDETYRRHSSASSAERLHSQLDAYAIPVPTHSNSHASIPQNYGSIGLGICTPEPMARTYMPTLVTPPAGFSSRRPPAAPGLVVTPAGPALFPASFTHHPSIIPPLSPTRPLGPFTPMTPSPIGCPSTSSVASPSADEKHHHHNSRGRAFARRTFSRPSISRISSRESSFTCGTQSTGPSRSTSMSREVLSESEAVDVVYKEIGLAGLAAVGPACTTPTRRRKFKHRKRARISWVDEKDPASVSDVAAVV